MKATVTFDVDDEIVSRLEGKIMPLFDDIRAEIEALKAAAADEHAQVVAALDALQAQVVNSVTDAEKGEILSLFAEAKAAIGGVYEPAVEEPPPAPEPLPPPEPEPTESV